MEIKDIVALIGGAGALIAAVTGLIAKGGVLLEWYSNHFRKKRVDSGCNRWNFEITAADRTIVPGISDLMKEKSVWKGRFDEIEKVDQDLMRIRFPYADTVSAEYADMWCDLIDYGFLKCAVEFVFPRIKSYENMIDVIVRKRTDVQIAYHESSGLIRESIIIYTMLPHARGMSIPRDSLVMIPINDRRWDQYRDENKKIP